MHTATQPIITRLTRQTRAESLRWFYTATPSTPESSASSSGVKDAAREEEEEEEEEWSPDL
jgi:hypothetical protein